MKEESIHHYLSKIIQDFSVGLSLEENKVHQKIRWIKEHKLEILNYFESLAKRPHNSLSSTSTKKITGDNWFRAVTYDYSKIPLSFEGSLKSFARFHRVGQPTIYLAENYKTAMEEVRFSKNLVAMTTFGIKINLQRILDLSGSGNLYKNFRISKNYFKGPWEQFSNIGLEYYTHYLSDHLRKLPIEGFLYESNANPKNICLCLFPEKMIKGSTLQVIGDYIEINSNDLYFEGMA